MRKFYFILLISFLSCYSSYSQQEPVYKVTKEYFRSNPFNKEFGSFLSSLISDPTVKDKTIERKTDTSLFYFHGTYTTHNPFFFKPKRVEVMFTEMVIPIDTLPPDTLYAYQLLAYNDDSKEAVQELKREFEKILKRYKNGFTRSAYTDNSADTKGGGETYNFFDGLHAISPFALSWFGPDDNKESCLVLTIRLDTYNNQAVLPMPFFSNPPRILQRER